jgi:hypothetical protein
MELREYMSCCRGGALRDMEDPVEMYVFSDMPLERSEAGWRWGVWEPPDSFDIPLRLDAKLEVS